MESENGIVTCVISNFVNKILIITYTMFVLFVIRARLRCRQDGVMSRLIRRAVELMTGEMYCM